MDLAPPTPKAARAAAADPEPFDRIDREDIPREPADLGAHLAALRLLLEALEDNRDDAG